MTSKDKRDLDGYYDRKHALRMRNEGRFLDRIERREISAEAMIGELVNGKHYIFPIGGKYREGTKVELVRFLMRNKYV